MAGAINTQRWERRFVGFSLATGVQPTCDCDEHWDTDDDSVTDLTDDGGRDGDDAGAPRSAAAKTGTVTTATGSERYAIDWDGVEAVEQPTRAAARLLHNARQMVDTSRWWTLRWPNNAISHLGRAYGLETEGLCKMCRELRKATVLHVRELWLTVMDRRHAADNASARNKLKESWLQLQRQLGRTRNRRGKLTPNWVTVKRKPLYTIRSNIAS